MAGAGPTVRLTFAGDETDLTRSMGRVGDSADQMERTFSMKGAAMAVAGAGLGAGLVDAFTNSLELDSANAKLEAQLGAGTPLAAAAGEAAGNLYAGAWGESMGEVNEAVRSVINNISGMGDASVPELESITASAIDLATAFDQDVGGVTMAVGQMMKTGLAPDAKTAFDIITAGFQSGVDKSGDFLDTLNEYGGQFQKFGLDGATATGLLTQGLQAGARDADVVADSIKEFSIRAIDGSKTTAEGFSAIGLSAGDMAAKIGAGGESASGALDLTLDKLRAIEDPVARDAAAVALFGTQAEDLGAALFALDPSEAAAGLGEVAGAAERMGTALNDTAAVKIEEVKRGFDGWLMSIVGIQGPLGSVAAGVVGLGGDAVGMIGSLGMAAVALRGLGIASGIATAAQWAWNVALSANPIGIVVMLIAGLVAALIWFFTQTEVGQKIVTAAWEGIKTGVAAGVAGVEAAVAWFGRLPALFAGWWEGAKAAAIGKATELVGWVQGLPGRFMGALGNIGNLLLNAGGALIDGFKRGVASAWNGLVSWFQGQLAWFRGLWPFSPAKWGPFSGSGYVTHSGEAMVADFADSLRAGMPEVGRAGTDLMGAAAGGAHPALAVESSSSGGGGSREVRFTGNTSDALATVIMQLIRIGKIQIT